MATYLITQATGLQSQWTIRHLLAAGAKVHAVVRNPENIPELLQRPGVTVFKGESVNFEDIFKAAQGCQGAFLITYPIPGIEGQMARTIAEACKKAGVKTVVAASTFCTGDKSLWDDQAIKDIQLHEYYSSKAEVENAVRVADFEAYAILRPAYISINYMLPHSAGNLPRLASHGVLDHIYDDDARMPQTDVSDIGRYAAAALQNPSKFNGVEVDLCAESLTIEEVRNILTRVSGRELEVKKWTREDLQKENILVFGHAFHLFCNLKNFEPLLAASKELHAKLDMPLTSLEASLEREKVRLQESLPK